MRDRWVLIYVVFVLVQVPLYFQLGRSPIQFDFSIKAAERTLNDYHNSEPERLVVEQSLAEARSLLEQMKDETSRTARVKLNEAIFLWKCGKPDDAVTALEQSHRIFVEKHGPDAFHPAAIEVRLAELHFLQRRYDKALELYRKNMGSVRDYLGPRHPFVVRQQYREVCSLVTLGKIDEARTLARKNLGLLKMVANEQDKQFLSNTGGCLDIMHRQGRFGGPPDGFDSWRSYLPSLNTGEQPVMVSDD